MTIKPSVQVSEFLRTLAPDPRRRLRLAIRSLAQGRGDIKSLEGDLGGYWRLRVGSYRVIFWQSTTAIECVYAERGSIIYEIFAEELRRKLADK